MNLNEYQDQAMSYRLPSADAQYAILNLASEVGELHGLIAKGLRDGYQLNYRDDIRKELGDILWMVAAIAADYEIPLADVAQNNINKLESRKARNVITGSGDNR